MNWDLFCKTAKNCTNAPFSLDSLSGVFRSIGLPPPKFSKPLASFTWLSPVRSHLLFPFFLQLRVYLAAAPLPAKQAYNGLVEALFSAKKSVRLVLEEQVHEEPQDIVQAHIARFEKNMANLKKPLFQNFAKPFSQLVLEKPELADKIDLQEKALLALNRAFGEALARYQQQSTAVLQKLFQLDLSAFHDIPGAARALMDRAYVTALPNPILFDAASQEKTLREIEVFFHEKLKSLEELLEKGQTRVGRQNEIQDFIVRARKALEKLRYYKDYASFYNDILHHIESFHLGPRELIRLAPEEVEKKIATTYETFCTYKASFHERMDEISGECKRFEQNFQDATRTIKRRLFEIFTGVTPFPDIREFLETQRLRLVAGMKEWHDGFFEGTLTVEEYSQKCFDLAYDHDVKQLRYDLSFRATRLREFRDVCLPLVMKLLEARRYLVLAGLATNPLSTKLMALEREACGFLHEIENPFRIFQHAGLYAFESANEIFRKLWIRLEEYQNRAKPLFSALEPLLVENQKTLEHAFFLALDDLEMVLKTLEGARPNLLGTIQHELSERTQEARWEHQKQYITRLEERFPFIAPFSFFQHIGEHKTRQNLLLEAKKVHERIENTKRFAKNLQAVKIFEEERVDVILEAFESQFFFEEDGKEGFKKYSLWASRAIDSVTEEVLLDIGLLDLRAVFSVEESRLQKTLYKALEKAKVHAKKVIARLESVEEAHSLREELQHLVELPLPVETSTSQLLSQLRSLVHLFFEARIVFVARLGNISASFEEFISSFRSFAERLEKKLLSKFEDDPVFGRPWIWQCFELRKKIEEFELLREERGELEPAMGKLFSELDEYLRDATPEEKEFVAAEKKKLFAGLDAFTALKKETAFEHPLHYVPGFLSYFRA